MPLYEFENRRGEIEAHFISMRALEQFKAENPDLRIRLAAPMVVSDINPYNCPITGKLISSNSEHRENLAKHGMRVMESDESPTKGKIRNAKFAAKRGLKVSDEFKDYDSSERANG